MISWNFTPRLPYSEASGDYVPGKALQAVKSLSQDEILTREGCQNTLNQPLDNNIPVSVEISVIELTGRHKDDFLETLQYNNLVEHLKSISSVKSSFGITIKNSLKQIDEANSLILYRIEDFNSNGLTGYEDTSEEYEGDEESNFFNLCRANFITSQNAKSTRGGSYGVGKSILWKSSLISTVLFSSYIENNKNGKLRLFGRSELATHKIKKNEYLGAGFFGETKKVDHGYASVSSWDNNDLAEKLYLNRDFSKGTGATALVIGYTDSFEEDILSPTDILNKSRENVAKYFWPCLIDSNKKLDVKFHHIRNGKIRNTYEIDLNNWLPFINAANNKSVDIANDVDLVARKKFDITIPESIEDPVASKFTNQAELSVYRGGQEFKNHDKKNTIALIRGFGMVVKYYNPTSTPINDSLPFFGVAKVGEAIDSTKKNENTENFFKFSEPPLHDSWEKSTESLKQRYKVYSKSIEIFYDSLSETLNKLCGKTENNSKSISSILSSMLNFGLKNEKKIQIKATNIQAKQIDEYIWKVGGTIDINKLKKNQNSWKTQFGFTIKEENKLGEKLSFNTLSFDNDENITLINETNLKESTSAIVEIKNVKYFSFEGEINTKQIIEKLDFNQIGNYNSSIISLGFYTKDVTI